MGHCEFSLEPANQRHEPTVSKSPPRGAFSAGQHRKHGSSRFAYVLRFPSVGATYSGRDATEMTGKCVRSSILVPQLATKSRTIQFFSYCVRIVSRRRQGQCGLFCSWLPAQIQRVLGKAWLRLCRWCFAWKVVHRCVNLRIIAIKKLRPSSPASRADRDMRMGYCSCPYITVSSVSSNSSVPNG